MDLKTETGTHLHPSTKVFKLKSWDKADKFAKESRSYVFGVYKDVRIDKKRERVLHGYGIPR